MSQYLITAGFIQSDLNRGNKTKGIHNQSIFSYKSCTSSKNNTTDRYEYRQFKNLSDKITLFARLQIKSRLTSIQGTAIIRTNCVVSIEQGFLFQKPLFLLYIRENILHHFLIISFLSLTSLISLYAGIKVHGNDPYERASFKQRQNCLCHRNFKISYAMVLKKYVVTS